MKKHIDIPNAEIFIEEDFFNKEKADKYFNFLSDPQNINWKKESMNIYGKEIDYPRLIAWYGELKKL